mmetsp:Transcript_16532/g.23126  ORF Transcript_16532/g.23126 Transcript_16532/m.23126 type:complete len:271 (-) Transcript_16532:427-1239(-)
MVNASTVTKTVHTAPTFHHGGTWLSFFRICDRRPLFSRLRSSKGKTLAFLSSLRAFTSSSPPPSSPVSTISFSSELALFSSLTSADPGRSSNLSACGTNNDDRLIFSRSSRGVNSLAKKLNGELEGTCLSGHFPEGADRGAAETETFSSSTPSILICRLVPANSSSTSSSSSGFMSPLRFSSKSLASEAFRSIASRASSDSCRKSFVAFRINLYVVALRTKTRNIEVIQPGSSLLMKLPASAPRIVTGSITSMRSQSMRGLGAFGCLRLM